MRVDLNQGVFTIGLEEEMDVDRTARLFPVFQGRRLSSQRLLAAQQATRRAQQVSQTAGMEVRIEMLWQEDLLITKKAIQRVQWVLISITFHPTS